MKITWYGHAAFLVETEGVRLILDPYRAPDCGGYGVIGDRADVVVVSHERMIGITAIWGRFRGHFRW